MGQEMAKQNNMKFYETSAKNGDNIQEAFEQIARDIIQQIDMDKAKEAQKQPQREHTPSVSLA